MERVATIVARVANKAEDEHYQELEQEREQRCVKEQGDSKAWGEQELLVR